jgi:hypothetical protein
MASSWLIVHFGCGQDEPADARFPDMSHLLAVEMSPANYLARKRHLALALVQENPRIA